MLNLFSYNMLIHLIKKFPHDGISQQLLGDIPPTGTLFQKTLDLKTIKSSILTLLNHKYQPLALQSLVHLEKERKNPFLKLYSETLSKNHHLIATIWKFLINLPETVPKEKVLELVGNLIKEILLIIEKMSTHLSKINKIHQQSIKVHIFLILVR